MADTERITWADGSWWEIRTFLTHGAARRVREAMQHELKVVEDQVEIDWNKVDLHELNEIMVLSGTVGWSYGPVDRETLGNVPEERYMEVLQRVNVLYGGLAAPLVSSDGRSWGRTSLWRSLVGKVFRRR